MSHAQASQLSDVVERHTNRGLRLQAGLRFVLVAFVGLTLLVVPPGQHVPLSAGLAIGYLVAAVAGWVWIRRRPGRSVDRRWLLLVLDIGVLTLLTYLAGASARDSWTAYVIVSGFFLVGVLSATQLSLRIGVALAVPTVGAYLFSAITTRTANEEPWASLIMRATILVAICLGCILLSRIQRSRVDEIAALAVARAELLRELTELEDRERSQLSEALHDGALQYVLAARMDLEDLRDRPDPDAADRVDHALGETVRLLRSTVSELHPAVLAQAGLVRALEDLAGRLRHRGIEVELTADGLPAGLTTPADQVAFAVAREACANIVKHASARSVAVQVTISDNRLSMIIDDDGRGFDVSVLDRRLAEGHIGIASQRLRVEAYGGSLDIGPAEPSGTRVRLDVPVGTAL